MARARSAASDGAAGDAVEERDAVEEEGGRERAGDEVLERRLLALRAVAVQPGQRVERDRHDLEGDEERDELEAGDEARACPRSRTAAARSTRRGRCRSRAGSDGESSTATIPIAEDQAVEEEREVVGGERARRARRRAPLRRARSRPRRPARRRGRPARGRRTGRAPPLGVKAWASRTTMPVSATTMAGKSGRRSSVAGSSRASAPAGSRARRRAVRRSRLRARARLATSASHRRLDGAREDRAGHAHERGPATTSGSEHARPRARDRSGRPRFAGLRDLAVEDALHHPQDVGRGQDHAQRRQRHQRAAERPGAHQDQELADEPVEARAPRSTRGRRAGTATRTRASPT